MDTATRRTHATLLAQAKIARIQAEYVPSVPAAALARAERLEAKALELERSCAS